MVTETVLYEYIGPKKVFFDRHAGTATVWNGKGDIQGIDPSFVPRFDEIYVDCDPPTGAQMRRITSKLEATKAKVDKKVVPAGTPYSGYSYEQLRGLYVQKVGQHAKPGLSASDLIASIQKADAELFEGIVSEEF